MEIRRFIFANPGNVCIVIGYYMQNYQKTIQGSSQGHVPGWTDVPCGNPARQSQTLANGEIV